MTDLMYETKANRVAQVLRNAITGGQIAPGEWIRADDWASRLNISQTPVREAIRLLEAEGLVRVFPHRGAQVHGTSRSEFEDVYRTRGALESLAVRLVIERSSSEDRRLLCARLRQYQAELHRLAATEDVAGSRLVNRRLHMTLYESAQSPRLLTMVQALWATFPWDTLALLPNRLLQAAQQHDEIIDAVERGDADAAAEQVREHVEGVARQLLLLDTVDRPTFLK